MVICPFCEYANTDDTMMCEHCGRGMSVFAGVVTRVIWDDVTHSGQWQPSPLAAPGDEIPVVFYVRGYTQPLVVNINERVIVGRSHTERRRSPHIDLTLYDAFAQGVSSQHISLHRQGDRLVICDLGSTNGTLLNGERLLAHEPAAIENGDEITLGRLQAVVYFENTVARAG